MIYQIMVTIQLFVLYIFFHVKNKLFLGYHDDTKVVSSSARNHNSFGDDVLAMALNMAGADTESLDGGDEISNIASNSQANQIIDDVEANLVSSTIMPQTPDPLDSKLKNYYASNLKLKYCLINRYNSRKYDFLPTRYALSYSKKTSASYTVTA